jgi:class 3 adenylate cyclase
MPADSPNVGSGGERREITVLFADLVGFTAFSERRGEEAAYELMQRISKLLREVVEQHGGTVGSFTGDGVMALFGVPQALEDAPLRACRAALVARDRLAARAGEIEAACGLHPALRIGIHTGLAVVGNVDGTFTAFGDAVNLAARLQALAEPGSVVLSDATRRRVEGAVEMRSLGTRAVKGKAEPQSLFRLDALRPAASRFDAAVMRGLTAYVGRDRELETLEGAFARIAEGPQVVDVVGEPGIGKSRLLYEFRQRIGDRAFVPVGSCSPDGRQTPFLPFLEIVRGSFRVAAGDPEADATRKLEEGLRAIGLSSERNVGLLLNLLGLKAPEGALHGLDGALIGFATRELLERLLRARCQMSPAVLVLEDLQWIDSASEGLLQSIALAEGPLQLLVVDTRRPEYEPPWVGRAKVTPLWLGPLSGGETARIVQARIGRELPADVACLVAEKAEGNPLFAEEIASFLVERDMLYGNGRGANLDPGGLVGVLPASLRSLLASRVDRLSPSDRKALQAAAVIGRRFDAELLSAVAETGPGTERQLEEMQALDLVHRDGRTGEYVFKHALVRDAVYDGLLSGARSALHLRIAEEIERRSANRLPEVAEVLAHHYAATSDVRKAFLFSAMAGRKCLDIFSLDEAERHYRRALDLLETSPDCADSRGVADVVADLLQVMFNKSEFGELKRLAERHLPKLEAAGDTPQLVLALSFLAVAFVQECEFRRCEEISVRAMSVAERVGDAKAMAYAHYGLVWSAIVLGRHSAEARQRMIAEFIAESERARDNYVLNWAYWCAAWDCRHRGLMREARERAWRLLDAGRKRDDRRALGQAHFTLAMIDFVEGEYEEAARHGVECIRTAVTPVDRKVGATIRAAADVFLRPAAEAVPELLELRSELLRSGWIYLASGTAGTVGVGLVLSGRVMEGIRTLERAVADAERWGNGSQAAWNRLLLAEVYLKMLAGGQTPPLRVIAANVGAILRVRISGARRVAELLDWAAAHPQLDGNGSICARIDMDRGLLHKIKRRPELARRFLMVARAKAERERADFMVRRIDTALADLPSP